MKKFEGYMLFRTFSIIQRLSQIFVTHYLKDRDIQKCHAPILMTIYLQEGLTQNELSKYMKFNKGAVAKLVKAIEHEGYIVRRSDENDKRVMHLYLAEKGRQAIPHIMELEGILSQQMLQGFSPEEKTQLHSMLDRIIKNMSNTTNIQ